jgi:hypothetical protein
MVAIIRTEWEGTSGGPGLTQFALMGTGDFSAGKAQLACNATRKFWDTMKIYLPDELRLQVSPIVDVYNEGDAELSASYTAATNPLVVAGTGATGYAGGAGFKINWNTGVIRNGRRVKGATFIVPALATCFGNTGTVQPTVVTAVNTAATTLMNELVTAGAPLLVWSRPLVKDGALTRTGAVSPVASGTCSAKSAILRGRRD